MSDRMIRDELLTSDRYWACSAEARNLYLSILLSADDCGRYTGANFALRVRCMAGTVDSERAEKLLAELHDGDLVRIYIVNDERFIFVPRFRQRLRYNRSKYPEPPKEINDLPKEKSDLSQTAVSPETDSSLLKRREEKRSKPLCAERISFDATDGWVGISDADRMVWRTAFPAVSLDRELAKARAWVIANPANRKSNWRRFLMRWLQKAQDEAPRAAVSAVPTAVKLW